MSEESSCGFMNFLFFAYSLFAFSFKLFACAIFLLFVFRTYTGCIVMITNVSIAQNCVADIDTLTLYVLYISDRAREMWSSFDSSKDVFPVIRMMLYFFAFHHTCACLINPF